MINTRQFPHEGVTLKNARKNVRRNRLNWQRGSDREIRLFLLLSLLARMNSRFSSIQIRLQVFKRADGRYKRWK